MGNFVNNDNMTSLMQGIAQKINAVNGAYVFKGSVAFANLPASLDASMQGYTYNVTDNFTTDSRFVEGAGKKYSAGTNVAIADVGTGYTEVTPVGTENPATEGWYEIVSGNYVRSTDSTVVSGKSYYEKNVNMKFDVTSTFVNVDALDAAIQAVSDMIAAEFSDATAYSTGDIVVHDGELFKFKADHAVGAWDSSEVDGVTVADLVDMLAIQIGVAKQAALDVIAPTFVATNAYSVGDYVIKDGVIYSFKSAHTAGDPWDATEVDTIGDVADLVGTVKTYADSLNTALTGRINNLADDLADEFDSTKAYAIGDVVVYQDKLYKFKAAHTANTAWNLAEVDAVRVENLVNAAEPSPLTTEQVNALLALLN